MTTSSKAKMKIVVSNCVIKTNKESMVPTFYGEITNKNKKLLIKLLIFYSFLLQRTKIAIANYTNDNTPHTCSSELSFILQKLQKDTEHIFKTFLNNRLKSNAWKMLLNNELESENCIIENEIKNEQIVKLFDDHVNNLVIRQVKNFTLQLEFVKI